MPAFANRYWTAADVRELPDDGNRYECIDGELLVTPAPRGLHQASIRDLFRLVDAFVRHERLGEFLWSPADIELEPDSLVQPDLFVATLQPGIAKIRNWTDVSGLLLAIEVLSPSTARYDRVVKRRFYQRAGVGEYWIVDLDARVVERWTPATPSPDVLSEELRWHPAGAATALVIDLPAFFAALLD